MNKTYTTEVPYKVVRAGEYLLSSKTKFVNSIQIMNDGSVIMIIDRENAFVFDLDSFTREVKKTAW